MPFDPNSLWNTYSDVVDKSTSVLRPLLDPNPTSSTVIVNNNGVDEKRTRTDYPVTNSVSSVVKVGVPTLAATALAAYLLSKDPVFTKNRKRPSRSLGLPDVKSAGFGNFATSVLLKLGQGLGEGAYLTGKAAIPLGLLGGAGYGGYRYLTAPGPSVEVLDPASGEKTVVPASSPRAEVDDTGVPKQQSQSTLYNWTNGGLATGLAAAGVIGGVAGLPYLVNKYKEKSRKRRIAKDIAAREKEFNDLLKDEQKLKTSSALDRLADTVLSKKTAEGTLGALQDTALWLAKPALPIAGLLGGLALINAATKPTEQEAADESLRREIKKRQLLARYIDPQLSVN